MGLLPHDQARQKVLGPAIGLIIAGALNILVGTVYPMLPTPPPGKGGYAERLDPEAAERGRTAREGIAAGMGTLSGMVGIGLLIGGTLMMKLQNYGFVFAANILALIPCISCCFPVSIPFGIWGLVVLNNPDVRAAFH
jgi:hypothetical protein